MRVMQHRLFLDDVDGNVENIARNAGGIREVLGGTLATHRNDDRLFPGAAAGTVPFPDIHGGDPGKIEQLILYRLLDRADHRPIP